MMKPGSYSLSDLASACAFAGQLFGYSLLRRGHVVSLHPEFEHAD